MEEELIRKYKEKTKDWLIADVDKFQHFVEQHFDNRMRNNYDKDPLDNNIWVEKYRPRVFSEIVGQNEIINKVQKHINNLSHMIFDGKAGTGKTTCARVIANTLDADIMELNSSDERGIEIVRGKILNFCKHGTFNRDAPFKILFLDEADNMTPEAQKALCPIIEKYSINTRFIMGCNCLGKIILPIISRCKVYRFKPIDDESIIKRLEYIRKKENIPIDMGSESFQDLIENADGDLRNAINSLQMGDYI